MSTVIYEFTAYAEGVEEWSTTPANMVNGTETDYASTATDGDIQKLTGNEGDGTDLGTISKVEIRAYAYSDDNDQLILRPVFGGSDDGDNHTTVPGVDHGWGAWQDITSDTNAPDWSSWSHVQDLDCDIEQNDVSKGNTMYCGMAQVQVTYDPPSGDVTVDAVLATATATGLVPTVTGGALVSGELATATATGLVPTVSGGTGATISGILATAPAAALVPTVTGGTGTTVSAALATATATALVPVITGDALITSVVAGAAAAGLVPTVTGGATVSGQLATAIAVGLVATVTGGARIGAELATAIAATLLPTITGGALVSGEVATATAAALIPIVTGGSGEAEVVHGRRYRLGARR